jgi:hypothetical protein
MGEGEKCCRKNDWEKRDELRRKNDEKRREEEEEEGRRRICIISCKLIEWERRPLNWQLGWMNLS